jgi:hypothetical protein
VDNYFIAFFKRDNFVAIRKKCHVHLLAVASNKKSIQLSEILDIDSDSTVSVYHDAWCWNIVVSNFSNNKATNIGHDNRSVKRQVIGS